MGEVIAHLAMSLDGFIADPDDEYHLRYQVRRED
jgi:riboflavin biosynthesis pyrimidine reductase